MKNIKNLWLIICKSSSVDRDTNAISLFDVVEEITVTSSADSVGIKDSEMIGLPVEFVTMWQRDEDLDKELSAKIKIVSSGPKESETTIGPIPFTFEKGKSRMRLRIKMAGIVFNGFGQYKIKVLLEDKNKYVEVQETSLEIKASVKI